MQSQPRSTRSNASRRPLDTDEAKARRIRRRATKRARRNGRSK